MQLAAVTRRVSAQAPGTWFAALSVTCLAVTAAVWVAGPAAWQSLINPTQETDATVATALGIWMTNFLVVAVPVVAAAFAYGSRANGKERLGRWLIVFATVTLFRNPIAVGFVGGLDPALVSRRVALVGLRARRDQRELRDDVACLACRRR